jgi:hypothetical protein
MKLRSLALGGTLLLATPAFAESYYDTNPTPQERAQTNALNVAAAGDAAATADAQQNYNADRAAYDADRARYDADRARYDAEHARFVHRWDVYYSSDRFRDVEAMHRHEVIDLAVRTQDGDFLGHIRNVDTGSDGRVTRVGVNISGERTAWIDATDLRYDRDNGNAVTDLSRRQVDGMALMRFPR